MPEEGEPDFRPVTATEWDDLQALFADLGSLQGCWCMWWRIRRTDFKRQFGEGNRQAMQAICAGWSSAVCARPLSGLGLGRWRAVRQFGVSCVT